MSTIEEKRVYGDKTDRTEIYVAAALGLARVSAAADRIGEFSLVARTPARSVATVEGRLAVATDENALVGSSHEDLEPLDVGPASAVSFADGDLIVAGEDGRVHREADGAPAEVGTLDAAVNAADGDLLATDEGVFRVGSSLSHAGLSHVADVAAAAIPLAATDSGLYKLGNGWMDVLEGDFECVAAAGDRGKIRRAHAATAETLHAFDGERWIDATPDAGPIVDVGYGGAVYAATADGTLLADGGDGWRDRALGLRGVRELAVRR